MKQNESNNQKPSERAVEPELATAPCSAGESGRRVIARFHPQAWVNDYAVSVDPEGDIDFDVTETVVKMGRGKALSVQDDDYESDELRQVETAPEWIREWGGPFWVEVEESIQEFFSPNAASDLSRHE